VSKRPLSLALLAALLLACPPNGVAQPGATTSAAPASSSSGAATASAASNGGSASDWPTYNGDTARAGASRDIASFSSVADAWQTDVVDGDVYGEPIVARGMVIVVTERNFVYAFDAKTGAKRWTANFGIPVDAATLPCGNIRPVSGITSTPVADTGAGIVYVVAFERPAHHELYALDLGSGAIRAHRTVDPPGADPNVHQQRSALALANGNVYVPYGGLLGDCGAYRGSIVAASTSAWDAPLRSYVVPANREAGIWAPPGIAIDADGRLYAATGNSDSSGTFDMNDAVIRLTPDLKVEDYWAPSDWLALSRSDTDIGSVGPTLLPGGLAIEAGKNGYVYLLRAGALGRIGGEVTKLKPCGSVFGGFAFADGVAYVPCTDGLAAVRVDGTTLRALWRGPRSSSPGSAIVAGGAVWVTDPVGGMLWALDPANGSVRYQRSVGKMQHFTTPAASGDLIYIAADGKLIALRMR
jgi:outer membrane protein assembly factor BamB